MSAKRKNLFHIGLAVVFLVGAALACCPTPAAGAVTVVINSPANGSTIVVGQEVLVDSTITAAAGVNRADLAADGQVVRHDSPPDAGSTTFRVIQPWTPTAEGQVTVSVVAYDVNGASGQATITLQVVASGGVVPTAGPGSVVPPGPTETPPPPVTTEAGCTLGSQYVADVTIPDGTVMSPNAAFVKTWKVKNSGTCDWDASFELIFVGGAQMSGPASVALPAVPAGGQSDVSVNLVAPSSPGTHKGTWRIRAGDGTVFGTNLTVLIEVPAPATDTPVPTDVPTETPLPTETPFGGGGLIAYVSFRDGNAEIYVMEEDDASPTRLTNNPEIDSWPDWSPDGTKIAFTRYSAGKPDIFVMNADGSAQVNLTNNADWDTGPSWSPDGSKIVFASNRVGGVLQIWVMNADGSGATQLTDTPKLNSSPDWSPDGSRIAFESMRDNQREIYVMNADGTGQTRLTFTDNNYGPKWSPDSNWLVFSSSDGIWKMKGDGTNLMQVTTNAGPLLLDLRPCWSPDGTLIIFDSKRGGNGDLWVVKPDGTGLQKLTEHSSDDTNPTWR